MQQGSLINNGIVIQAVDKASGTFHAIGRSFNQMRSEFSIGLQTIPRQTREAFRPFEGVRRLMNTELAQAFKEGSHTIDEGFDHFNAQVRRHVNTFNSIIMGGVALAMSGLGIRRAGQAVTGMIAGWVEHASEFEKVMRQVKFLGQVSTEEYQRLTDRIVDIGIALPTSSLKVAEGTLDALRLGFGADEAEYMAEPIAMMEFFSEGALTTADSAQFLNAIIRQLNLTAEDSTDVLDKLMSTARYTAFTIDELWRAWQSARAAPGGLALEGTEDLPAFLTMLGAARTALTPRYAGRIINSYVRAVHQAAGSPGARGESWAMLGIDLDELQDPIEILEIIAEKSKEIWGEGSERRQQLQSMLGIEAMPIIDAFDAFAKRSDESLQQMRDNIADSKGFAEDYMDEMLYTYWGVRELLLGTIDTLKQLLGELFFPILVPALQYAQRFFQVLIDMVRAQPGFARLVATALGLGGAFAVVLGTAMLFAGQLFSIYGSLMNVMIQLAALKVNSTAAFGAMAGQTLTVGSLLRSQIATPLAWIRTMFIRLTAVSGFLYLAWRYDFLRIRTIVTDFFSNFGNMMDRVRYRMEYMSGQAVHLATRMDLESTNFWRRLTGYITIATILWQGLTQTIQHFREHGIWALHTDMMSMLTGLSKHELMEKDVIDPKDYPLLRILTTAIYLIQSLQAFWDGFVSGLQRGYAVLEAAVLQPLSAIFGGLADLQLFVFDEEREMWEPNLTAWENFGNLLGSILSIFVAIKTVTFLWKNAFSHIWTIGKKLVGVFGGLNIKNLFTGLGKRDFSKAVDVARRDFPWAGGRPEGVGTQAGQARWAHAKHLPFGLDRLFGTKMIAHKTGETLGRTRGILPDALVKTGTQAFGRGPLGKILGRIPLLGGLFTGLSALGAEPGQRVAAGTETAVGVGGAWAGGKAGGAIGSAIAPGIGTAIGAIVGAIAGGIAASPLGEIIGAWAQDVWNFLRANVFNMEAMGRLFEAFTVWATETMPSALGEWVGYWGATITKFLYEEVILEVPNWFKRLGLGIYNAIKRLAVDIYTWMEEEAGGSFHRAVTMIFSRMITALWESFQDNLANIRNIGSNLWSGLVSGIRGGWGGDGYSRGGFIRNPHIAQVGEDGDEAIIPLDKYRNRAVQLWRQTGQELGVKAAPADQKFERFDNNNNNKVEHKNTYTTDINFSEGAVVIRLDNIESTKEARKGAKKLMAEFKKLVEEEQMRNYKATKVR